MPKIRDDHLTPKEAKAVEVLVSTGDRNRAISEAYNTSHPAVMANQVFGRPRVKAGILEAFKLLNITTDKIIQRFDKQASYGKNEASKVRANENLAQLADLYPDRHQGFEDTGAITIKLDY